MQGGAPRRRPCRSAPGMGHIDPQGGLMMAFRSDHPVRPALGGRVKHTGRRAWRARPRRRQAAAGRTDHCEPCGALGYETRDPLPCPSERPLPDDVVTAQARPSWAPSRHCGFASRRVSGREPNPRSRLLAAEQPIRSRARSPAKPGGVSCWRAEPTHVVGIQSRQASRSCAVGDGCRHPHCWRSA